MTSTYSPTIARSVLGYIAEVTDFLGLEKSRSTTSFINHFAAVFLRGHREGISPAEVAEGLRAEVTSWTENGMCLRASGEEEVDDPDDIKPFVQLTLNVEEESSADDTRLFASIAPLDEYALLHSPACSVDFIFTDLADELASYLGLHYIPGEQLDDRLVEIGLEEEDFGEIEGYASTMRDAGWKVIAAGFGFDEDAEQSEYEKTFAPVPWYLDYPDGRRSHMRSQETLGAVQKLLAVADPAIELECWTGRELSQFVARAALAMTDTEFPLIIAAAEHADIGTATGRGGDPAYIGARIASALLA